MCACVFILTYSYGCFFAPHQLSDSGIYTCVATSSSGETSWSAFLEVKGETRLYDCKNARERTFILCFCEDRDSVFAIYSESGGVMVMKNHDENELPGPPSKPQVTDVTKNSVSLSWQPGLAGASPVSSFVIEAFRLVLPAYTETFKLPLLSLYDVYNAISVH